jgi:hypothetical protein
MQQSEPDVHSLEELIALLERQSNLQRQAFEYLTQLPLTSLTLEYEVEWKSDCEAVDGKLSDDEFDPSASEYDPSGDEFDDDSIPSSSHSSQKVLTPSTALNLPASQSVQNEAPAAEYVPAMFGLPDYDTEIPRPPHGGSAPAAGEGAGFSGPEYDPECGSSMIPLAHWDKLAAAILRLGAVLRT